MAHPSLGRILILNIVRQRKLLELQFQGEFLARETDNSSLDSLDMGAVVVEMEKIKVKKLFYQFSKSTFSFLQLNNFRKSLKIESQNLKEFRNEDTIWSLQSSEYSSMIFSGK